MPTPAKTWPLRLRRWANNPRVHWLSEGRRTYFGCGDRCNGGGVQHHGKGSLDSAGFVASTTLKRYSTNWHTVAIGPSSEWWGPWEEYARKWEHVAKKEEHIWAPRLLIP